MSYHFRRTRVKICGFTREQDARVAAALGVDAIGLVFYPKSPRHVAVEAACRIARAMPPFVTRVGLFVDERRERILEVLGQVPIDLIQFHGDEPPEFCRAFGRPYIKAVRMHDGIDLATVAERYADAAGLLLDAYDPSAKGGTGSRFDWSRIPRHCPLPIILAGGLSPDNAAEAIRAVRPYALDVSSGVESGKGIKDADKMAAFLTEVHECECTDH